MAERHALSGYYAMSVVLHALDSQAYLMWTHYIVQSNDDGRKVEALDIAVYDQLGSRLGGSVRIGRLEQAMLSKVRGFFLDLSVYLGGFQWGAILLYSLPVLTSSVDMW